MKRFVVALSLIALCAIVPAHQAHGQVGVWVGGSLAVPLSDTKDVMDNGTLFNVGIGTSLMGKKNWFIGGDVFFGSMDAKVGGASSDITAVLGAIGYDLMPDAKLGAYVFAGGGMLKADPGDSKGAYQFGGGLGYDLTPKLSVWADARYLASTGEKLEKMTIMPVTVGLTWILGGS